MALFHSDVYDAFREVGVSHEKALAAAVALYATTREPVGLPSPVHRVEYRLTILIAMGSVILGLLITILLTLIQR